MAAKTDETLPPLRVEVDNLEPRGREASQSFTPTSRDNASFPSVTPRSAKTAASTAAAGVFAAVAGASVAAAVSKRLSLQNTSGITASAEDGGKTTLEDLHPAMSGVMLVGKETPTFFDFQSPTLKKLKMLCVLSLNLKSLLLYRLSGEVSEEQSLSPDNLYVTIPLKNQSVHLVVRDSEHHKDKSDGKALKTASGDVSLGSTSGFPTTGTETGNSLKSAVNDRELSGLSLGSEVGGRSACTFTLIVQAYVKKGKSEKKRRAFIFECTSAGLCSAWVCSIREALTSHDLKSTVRDNGDSENDEEEDLTPNMISFQSRNPIKSIQNSFRRLVNKDGSPATASAGERGPAGEVVKDSRSPLSEHMPSSPSGGSERSRRPENSARRPSPIEIANSSTSRGDVVGGSGDHSGGNEPDLDRVSAKSEDLSTSGDGVEAPWMLNSFSGINALRSGASGSAILPGESGTDERAKRDSITLSDYSDGPLSPFLMEYANPSPRALKSAFAQHTTKLQETTRKTSEMFRKASRAAARPLAQTQEHLKEFADIINEKGATLLTPKFKKLNLQFSPRGSPANSSLGISEQIATPSVGEDNDNLDSGVATECTGRRHDANSSLEDADHSELGGFPFSEREDADEIRHIIGILRPALPYIYYFSFFLLQLCSSTLGSTTNSGTLFSFFLSPLYCFSSDITVWTAIGLCGIFTYIEQRLCAPAGIVVIHADSFLHTIFSCFVSYLCSRVAGQDLIVPSTITACWFYSNYRRQTLGRLRHHIWNLHDVEKHIIAQSKSSSSPSALLSTIQQAHNINSTSAAAPFPSQPIPSSSFLSAVLHDELPLPGWVQFPDVERVEWFNKAMERWWPYLQIAITNSMKASLNPLLEWCKPQFLSGIKFSYISFGDKPPIATGVRLVDTDVSASTIILDLDVRFAASDTQSAVVKATSGTGLSTKIILSELVFCGTVRLIFEPLWPEWPGFACLSVAFVGKPLIDFHLSFAKMSVTGMPMISSWLHSFLKDTLVEYIIWPRMKTIQLWDGAPLPQQHATSKMAEGRSGDFGVLRLTVIEAKELLVGGLGDLGGALSDLNLSLVSYDLSCVASLVPMMTGTGTTAGAMSASQGFADSDREQIQKSRTVTTNDMSPKWDQEFLFMLRSGEPRMLRIDVQDHKRIGPDSTVGYIALPLSTLEPGKLEEHWIPLKGCKKGSLRISIKWRPLQYGQRKLDEEGDGDADRTHLPRELDAVSGSMEGVLLVTLLSASDLIVSGRTAGTEVYVVIKAPGCEDKKSSFNRRTKDPTWNEKFWFYFGSLLKYDMLTIEVMERDMFTRSTSIGVTEIRIEDVRKHGQLFDKWQLEGTAIKQGKVKLRLEWCDFRKT